MSFGGTHSGNHPGLQRPLPQAHSQPIGIREYSFQTNALGLSNFRQEGPVHRDTFLGPPHTYQVDGGRPSFWSTRIPAQPNTLSENYVQMLEQELAIARRRNQEYETTILQLANILSKPTFVGNHNRYPSHAFTPAHSLHPQPQFSLALGAQGENVGMPPPDYSRHALNGLQHPPPIPRNPPPLPSYPISRPIPGIPAGLASGKNVRRNSVVPMPPPPRPPPGPRPPRSHPTSIGPRSKIPIRSVECNPGSTSAQHKSVISMPQATKRVSSSSHSTSKGSFSKTPDWSVEYSPGVHKTLEVNLMRTITDVQGAFHIKFSPNGKLLAVVARVGQVVTIYHVETGSKICQLEDLYEREEPPSTQDISFSSNGNYLATCTEDPENIIRIWDVGKKCIRNVLKGHLNAILSVDFSPNGRLLISGSSDGTVRIWNIRDGSSRIFFRHSTSYICSIRFSPDGKHVAGGGFNADVFLWDLRSRQPVAPMTGHTNTVPSVVFMPDGEGLISGSWDRTLKYWDNSVSTSAQPSDRADDAKRKVTFVGNTAEILSVSIPLHGQWIATGSFDCTVGIWSTRTGARQCILKAHAKRVYSVDFSPVGDYLASADWTGTVRIWSCKDLLSGSGLTVENSRHQSGKQL